MKHLILAGAGHAHQYVLKQLAYAPLTNTKVTIISPSPSISDSQMIEQWLHGANDSEQTRKQLTNFVRRAKAFWIDDHIVRIDAKQKLVHTKKGVQLPYDVLSLDIGAGATLPDIAGVKEHTTPVKQNALTPHHLRALLKAPSCAIVGNTPFALDLALSLRDRRVRDGTKGPVHLITHGTFLPALLDDAKRSKLEKWLLKRGVLPVTGTLVKQVAKYANEQKTVYMEDGRSIDLDQIAWLADASAYPVFNESGLEVDAHGFVMSSPTLQLLKHPHIFAVGACKTFVGSPHIDRTGLFAKQESKVLWKNLQAQLGHSMGARKLAVFVPHRNRFAMLNAGFRQTILFYQDWMFAGSWCWWFKEQLE